MSEDQAFGHSILLSCGISPQDWYCWMKAWAGDAHYEEIEVMNIIGKNLKGYDQSDIKKADMMMYVCNCRFCRILNAPYLHCLITSFDYETLLNKIKEKGKIWKINHTVRFISKEYVDNHFSMLLKPNYVFLRIQEGSMVFTSKIHIIIFTYRIKVSCTVVT